MIGSVKSLLRDADIRLTAAADSAVTTLDGILSEWSKIRGGMGTNLTAELAAFASLKSTLRTTIAASPATRTAQLGSANTDD